SVPRVTAVTFTAACWAVSAGSIVASGRVPGASMGEAGLLDAAGGSSPASVRSASRLQPLRAIVASAAARARWVGLKVMRAPGIGVCGCSAFGADLRNLQYLPGLDPVGVIKLVAVGLEDVVPAAGLAVETLGDMREGVAALD